MDRLGVFGLGASGRGSFRFERHSLQEPAASRKESRGAKERRERRIRKDRAKRAPKKKR